LNTKFTVSVRDLVEQIERSGDINFRFSTRSNALEGIRGHQKLQKSRSDNYLAEVKVIDQINFDELELEISGRVDGYYPDSDNFIVEEIKTIKVDVETIPASVSRLFWAQVKVYACLLARKHEVESHTIRLCYLDLNTQEEHQLNQLINRDELETFYQKIVNQYIVFLRNKLTWVRARNDAVESLVFPYNEYRVGQREMAVTVYKALKNETQLVLQAPTGIGKTIASIFPAIKSMPTLHYEKLFYVSAKVSGQLMARNAVQDLKQAGLKIRDVTLTAKDKICFTKGSLCDAEFCEYAKGYYDKLPGVMEQVLLSDRSLDRIEIERIAEEETMCPFELSLDLSTVADIVICDYNYFFDPVVYLRRYFENKQSRFILLMDEAHNLVDRGRDMFSAELDKQDFLDLKSLVKKVSPLLAKRLTRINAEFLALLKNKKVALETKEGVVLEDTPIGLHSALRNFVELAADSLQQNQEASSQSDLLNLYFLVLAYLRTSEYVDENYRYLLNFGANKSRKKGRKGKKVCSVKIYCLNPGPKLAEGFKRITSSVCFSATLNPQSYFNTLMGVEDNAAWYQIESPFSPDNLGVFRTSYISTTFNNRTASIYELVDTLANIFTAKKGNYIVYFPSYVYLLAVLEKFTERHAQIETLVQSRRMDEDERNSFLDRFTAEGEGLLGFAVMGGAFGEGIDLKGPRLIGAIIVGVGLPQIGLERDLIRDHFDQVEGGPHGFEFAYQYPGINRVLQTAGRVIRSETDKGIVCLIDHRFNEQRYQRLLPPSWQMVQARNRQQLVQQLDNFWQRVEITEDY